MRKTRKEEGVGAKKALNYGKQGRQTVNENIAGTQYKGPCIKACKGQPLRMAAANQCWQHSLKFNLA